MDTYRDVAQFGSALRSGFTSERRRWRIQRGGKGVAVEMRQSEQRAYAFRAPQAGDCTVLTISTAPHSEQVLSFTQFHIEM